MTKGTKIFRIIICILLGLTMLFSAFFAVVFVAFVEMEVVEKGYDIFVAGVEVNRDNEDDVLGDGTVYYDSAQNLLTFDHAEIEYDYSVIYSGVDLIVELIGENKFVLSGDVVPAIHVSRYMLSKDLKIIGEGSLSIEFKGTSTDALAIYARDLRIESDITITMPDCSNIANAIYSDASFVLSAGATVTVNNGAGAYCTAVKVRNNLDIEANSTLNVSARSGNAELCRGVHVGGSLVVWENATLNVSVDDREAKTSECINVSGLLRVKDHATVAASAKKACAVACYGAVELKDAASLSASSEGEGVDLLCYGAIVNYGATVNGEVEALAGIHNK
jgi:hypothetical protein